MVCGHLRAEAIAENVCFQKQIVEAESNAEVLSLEHAEVLNAHAEMEEILRSECAELLEQTLVAERANTEAPISISELARLQRQLQAGQWMQSGCCTPVWSCLPECKHILSKWPDCHGLPAGRVWGGFFGDIDALFRTCCVCLPVSDETILPRSDIDVVISFSW